jgi:succinyl-CoA--D-citramalate CoA-transferase
VVPRFKRNPGRVRWLGKADIGADTEAVLGELGYSHEAIAGLSADGVIKTATASGGKT